ncbi:MAG TPA: PIN domain-containing protein, partial [Gemmatimonadaceae bacterium]|nr:PIN domain-containing protein [Gemmatimonadaceae bacterium]
MTLVLLDTTFLVDAERDDSALDRVIADDDDVAIAAITVAELLVGVEMANSKRRRATRETFVFSVLEAVPVVTYDERIARSHAELLVAARRAGRPRGAHDLIIAATAHATGRTVVTADASAFL